MALKFSMKALVVTAIVSSTTCVAADMPNSEQVVNPVTPNLITPTEKQEISKLVPIEGPTISVQEPEDTVVIDGLSGSAVFRDYFTEAGNSDTFTIINNQSSVSSSIKIEVANTGTSNAKMCVTDIAAHNGKFIVTLTNKGTESLNGDIWINFLLLN